MTPSMSSVRTRASLTIARVGYHLGFAGVTGLGLLLTAAFIVVSSPHAWTWMVDPPPSDARIDAPSLAPLAAMPAGVAPQKPEPTASVLRTVSDVRQIVAQMERAATAQGLPWNQADYKLLEATDAAPGSVEVRLSTKGSYIGLRRFLAELRTMVPGLVLRSFSVTRPTPEASEIEAKLTLGVLLSESADRARPGGLGATR